MKKITLLLLVSATLLCACNKSNSTPEQKEDEKLPQLAKVALVANFGEISSDVLDYFKITFNLTDYLGKTQSYDITGPQTIKMTIENPKLKNKEPAYNHTIELLITKKNTPLRSEDQYDFIFNCDICAEGIYADGKTIKTTATGYRDHNNRKHTMSYIQDYLNYSQIHSESYGFYLTYNTGYGDWILGWN